MCVQAKMKISNGMRIKTNILLEKGRKCFKCEHNQETHGRFQSYRDKKTKNFDFAKMKFIVTSELIDEYIETGYSQLHIFFNKSD